MKRIFQCFTLLFFCYYTSIAQDGLKRHKVSSGETLFSIAKKYNVTPYDLQKVNPELINGIKVDEVLLIPETKIKTPILESAASSIKASVVPSSISHTVKTGETKYSIAKRFGLTITTLETQNPQIIEGLKLGDVLEIFPAASYSRSTASDAASTTTTASPVTQPQTGHPHDGKRHVVAVGETLARIANANGLTVDQLTAANSRVLSRGLIAGRPIWIPGSKQLNAGDSYSHVVKTGDTKFGLSLRFNTTIANLERQNPDIKSTLQIGQTITMASSDGPAPTRSYASQNDTQEIVKRAPSEEDINKVEDIKTVSTQEKTEVTEAVPTHTEAVDSVQNEAEKTATVMKDVVEIKEEKIIEIEKEKVPAVQEAIVTVEEAPLKLEEKNIKETPVVPPVQPGLKIETPSVTAATPTPSEPEFLSYEIQPKETLYGLAQKANMTISDFLILNPQLRESVQVGSVIKMPAAMKPKEAPSETISAPVLERDFSIPFDLTTTANTSQLKKLLFFLPFSQEEYQKEETNSDNFKSVTDDFKRVHLEFYQGANIAIDSLRKMYLSLDVKVVEAPSNLRNSQIKPLLEKHEANDYDAIILPFYDTIEEEVAAFTVNQDIPVITASTMTFESVPNNLYTAVPSLNLQRKKVLDYMIGKEAHIIVLNDATRPESKTFISEYAPQADFVNIKKNGSFSEAELIGKFKKDKLNYVVIDSKRTSVFLNTTNALMSELSNYKLQLAVLETALIPEEGFVSEKRYRILNMVFPSLIPAKSTTSSKQFLSSFQKEYNLLPSVNVMLGFDITFDSLLRMIQQQSFERSAVNDITEYTQLKFNYEKNNLGGFTNEGIYILQYDSDANIREAN